MPRYSDQYVNKLLEQGDYDALVQLQGIVIGWDGFAPKLIAYGLPASIFTFVEVLTWFAQSLRSGAWTYYEATPTERQVATCEALRSFAPPEYSQRYAFGSENWKDQEAMKVLDEWIDRNDDSTNTWMFELLKANRHELSKIYV